MTRVLFIGGLGRSGTTLIEKLLNEVPGTVSVGETLHLWERGVRDHERCGCGEPFAECPRWAAIGERAFGGWDRADVDDLIELRWRIDRTRSIGSIVRAVRSGLDDEQARYVDALKAVLQAAAEVSDAQVVLDSSKHLSTAALLAADPDLDVRVLHVVRDPRGVAYSWTKQVARPEADGDDMPTYSPARTALRWVTDNLGFDALGRLGVSVTRLRYEDVLADPDGSLRRILAAASLDVDQPLDFIDGRTAHVERPMHSIAGNPMRFGGDDLVLRLDDAWQTKLGARDRRIVTTITRPVLGRFGYRPNPTTRPFDA